MACELRMKNVMLLCTKVLGRITRVQIKIAIERLRPVMKTNSYIQKLPPVFRIQGSDPGQRDPLVLELY